MPAKLYVTLTMGTLILFSLACATTTPSPQANPNAFNTMVAQTAQVQLTQLAPTQPIQPVATMPPVPTPFSKGPAILVNATVSLPRQMAIDLDTQATSGPHNTGSAESYLNATNLPNMDILFFAPQPEWQFLIPLNNTPIALPKKAINQVDYQGCVDAFTSGDVYGKNRDLGAFPLDTSVFGKPSNYICFVTDRGQLGTLTIPDDSAGISAVSITYTIWDTSLP